jgi:uncharacterized protein YcnI
MGSWFRRGAALTASAAAVFLLTAPAALAHVTVSSTDAVAGGFGVLTFRVPTESDTASTTKLTVGLPTDHPLAFVSVQPHPGWSVEIKQTRLAKPIEVFGTKISKVVGQISWTADSAASAVHPGEFEQFNISVGPLPDVQSLAFPALQRYSDGGVVRWIEQSAPGSSDEPEHPAPTLVLGGPDTAEEDDDSDTDSGTILGIIGIALGATALALALRRRPAR